MSNDNRSKKNSKPGGEKKKSTSNAKPPMPKRSQKPRPASATKPTQNISKPIKSDDIRLNKYIANSGVCSRRDADIYIQSGNVKVNGEVIIEMGHKVKPGDVVNFDGKTLIPEKKEYILLNKPKNFTTSNEDEMDYKCTRIGKRRNKIEHSTYWKNGQKYYGIVGFYERYRYDSEIQFTQPKITQDLSSFIG
jgi:23S rRNA pseudouridine2605 synthase